ncbi:36549_t:CDS:2, partial [Gigaspora margarita]
SRDFREVGILAKSDFGEVKILVIWDFGKFGILAETGFCRSQDFAVNPRFGGFEILVDSGFWQIQDFVKLGFGEVWIGEVGISEFQGCQDFDFGRRDYEYRDSGVNPKIGF